MSSEPVNIVLADNQAILLEAFGMLIEQEPGLKTVVLARSGKEAIDLVTSESRT